MIRLRKMLASLAFGAIGLSAILARVERTDDSYVETMQAIRDASSQAQYRALEREAHAVFRATIARCRRMQDPQLSDCAKEARAQLFDELSEAKRISDTGL